MTNLKSDPNKRIDAYHNWIADKIRKSDQVRFETGKFTFTVATSSLGLLVVFSKLSTPSTSYNLWFFLAALAFVISSLFAVINCIPKVVSQKDDENVQDLHEKFVEDYVNHTTGWAFSWFFGIFFALIWIIL